MPAAKVRACTILGEFTRAQTELVGKAVIRTDGKAGTVENVWLDEIHGLRISIRVARLDHQIRSDGLTQAPMKIRVRAGSTQQSETRHGLRLPRGIQTNRRHRQSTIVGVRHVESQRAGSPTASGRTQRAASGGFCIGWRKRPSKRLFGSCRTATAPGIRTQKKKPRTLPGLRLFLLETNS